MLVTRRRGGMGEPAAVPLALLVVAVYQLAVAPLQNLVSRGAESEADWKALADDARPGSGARAVPRVRATSLGDPSPPTWAYVLLQTHPTLAQRVAMADAWAKRQVDGCPTEVGHRTERAGSGERVLGPGAALGRRQTAALGADRAALDAVRGVDEHSHRPVAVRLPDLVDVGRAHPLPHLGDVARHARPRRGCGSAGRRASGCPTRRPRRACRRSAPRRAPDSARRARSAQRRRRRSAALSSSFGGSFPFVTVIALASAPPRKKPLSNAWRMFRTSPSSFQR